MNSETSRVDWFNVSTWPFSYLPMPRRDSRAARSIPFESNVTAGNVTAGNPRLSAYCTCDILPISRF